MIESKLALCAHKIIRDAETNAISIIELIENIGARRFPIIVPQLTCLFRLVRAPSDSEQVDCIVTLSLGNNELLRQPVRVDFQRKVTTRVILNLIGVPFMTTGSVKIQLSIGDQLVGFSEFEVSQTGPPEVEVKAG
jgi:Family of unknown function (DUF6941)